LVEIAGQPGNGDTPARHHAVGAIMNIAVGDMEVKKGLFAHEGLIDGLIELAGKTGSEYKDEREYAVGAIRDIADGDMEVKKGLFKHEGLIDGLIEIAGQTGKEYKKAREYAVGAIKKIADGDDEVKAGLFRSPGLMPLIDAIIGDATLNRTLTKYNAKDIKDKIKQHDGDGGGSKLNATSASIQTASSDTTSRPVDLESKVSAMQSTLAEMASVPNSVAASVSTQSSKRSHSDIDSSSSNPQSSVIVKVEHIEKKRAKTEVKREPS
jgi:hypothetical protein